MKTFSDFAKMSYNEKYQGDSLPCEIELKEDGKTFKAYEVSISHGDLLFYCDNGCLNYVVDSYGLDDFRAELFNIELN